MGASEPKALVTTSASARAPRFADQFERNVHCVLGLPFDALDVSGAVGAIWRAVADRAPLFFSTPNLNFVVGALDDEEFRDSVLKSDLSLPDGMPVVWVSRILGLPIQERVGGSTVFELLHRGKAGPVSFYLFGGPDGVAEAAARKLERKDLGIYCCGYESPGFGSIEELSTPERIARINASSADFLVVSLGAKKGQAWIEHNRDRLHVPVVSHLGAALNFAAGTVKRAPAWMQGSGLEWLWRIKEEPHLWRRYLFDGATFVRMLFTQVLPLAWTLRRNRPHPEALAAATVAVSERIDGGYVLRMTGPWSAGNIDRLRPVFAAVADCEGTLHLDLEAVTFVDPGVIGLMTVLLGVRKRLGLAYSCGPVQSHVRRILRGSSAAFLFDPVSSPPQRTLRRRPANA